ncbi:hypothetical protein B0H19DRAFT_1130040 [Mycena capillaripes]|nr:hypothetical protein B0H19DRAFT_1130040 [Mycena capillaripes]
MQGYGVQAKRFKGQQVDESAYSNGSNEMYRRSSSPHDVEEYPPQQPRRRSASRSRNHPAAVHRFPPQYSTNAPSPEDSGRSSLLHLLKADDFDLASDARIEKYTRLSEKWKNCTREEWMTGADHLNGLYGKIFDFVKSHMAAKVQLFANCDEKLKQQGEVLRDRDMLLADVKDRLVADSGSVLSK